MPLWSLFLALLALTAAEVVLYDIWVKHQFIPKYALVILILVFTLPKAAIVMIYFMHLKFEKQIIVVLAIVPFFLATGGVLAILTDTMTLKPQARNQVTAIGSYEVDHGDGDGGGEHGHDDGGDEDDAGYDDAY